MDKDDQARSHYCLLLDGVVCDELRKTMIIQAAPGVHVQCCSYKKITEIAHDTRFDAIPRQCLRLSRYASVIEGGVEIKEANLGSIMAHSVGKVVVTNAVAMDEDDVKTLEAIREWYNV